MRDPERLAISRLLGWIAVLATVMVTPWASFDPINVPKLAVISVGGFTAIGAILASRREILNPKYRTIFVLGVAFLIDLTLVLLVSGTNLHQEFFGTSGRSTGYLAYAALLFLLLASVATANTGPLKTVYFSLMIAGSLSIIYGVAQALNMDPVKWANPYTPVIGFLGNPNFQSSFIGFCAVAAFAMLIRGAIKVPILMGLIAYMTGSIFVISKTESQQGFLVLIGGVFVVALLRISKSSMKKLTIPTLAVGLVGIFLVTIGILNKGPLASLLYKASVTYRGDYWRAGWKMSMEHPFFGVGLDSYGDWYRRTRTLEATLRRGPDVVSNAAHNVLLDFSSTGGFPLLVIYTAIMSLVLISAFKVLKRSTVFDPFFTALFAVWVTYQVQSIISLNQLGLAVWGWIISGLIIGYEINTRGTEDETLAKKTSKNQKSAKARVEQKVKPITTIGMFLGLSIGLLVGLPPLLASTGYKSAIESGDPKRYEMAAGTFPKDYVRVVQVSQNLENNGFNIQALEIVQRAALSFPDSYEVWNLYSQLSKASNEQKAEALAQMKRLDPLNPNLK